MIEASLFIQTIETTARIDGGVSGRDCLPLRLHSGRAGGRAAAAMKNNRYGAYLLQMLKERVF